MLEKEAYSYIFGYQKGIYRKYMTAKIGIHGELKMGINDLLTNIITIVYAMLIIA